MTANSFFDDRLLSVAWTALNHKKRGETFSRTSNRSFKDR